MTQPAAFLADQPSAGCHRLRGKRLALVRVEGARAERAGAILEWAVQRLGAHLARIHEDVVLGRSPDALSRIGGVLDMLYDAVVCEGLPVDRVEALRARTSIPVLVDVAWPFSADAPSGAAVTAHLDDREQAIGAAMESLRHAL